MIHQHMIHQHGHLVQWHLRLVRCLCSCLQIEPSPMHWTQKLSESDTGHAPDLNWYSNSNEQMKIKMKRKGYGFIQFDISTNNDMSTNLTNNRQYKPSHDKQLDIMLHELSEDNRWLNCGRDPNLAWVIVRYRRQRWGCRYPLHTGYTNTATSRYTVDADQGQLGS